jgi:predicted aspartyl protease
MPHFTLTVDAPGPVVNAIIAVSEGRRQALEAAGHTIPMQQVVRALIDTGASHTSVDPSVLAKLSLTPTGTIEIVTPSTGTGTHTTDTYDVDFKMYAAETDTPLAISNLRISACDLFLRQGIHVLIGRDILSRCLLVYNGTINIFSICF